MYDSEENELEEQQQDYESDLESERHEYESEVSYNQKEDTIDPKNEDQSDNEVSDSEQEVFNSKKFTAEAGLSNFDVDTDCK